MKIEQVNIKINNQIDKNIWNSLVNDKIFFRFEWFYIIQDSYQLKPYFILMQKGDNFALIASFKTTKGYISLPFVSYSGYFFNDKEMAKELKKYLIKEGVEIDSRDLLKIEAKEGYVNPIVTINSFEEFWKNISSNTRNQFKKSQKNSFIFEKEENIENFYKLYSLGMRNLGTPAHSKKYFNKLMEYLPYCIFTIYDNDNAIGSMFCLKDNETLAVLYAYTLPSYSKQYANYFLYLNAIKWLSNQGLKYLDMGRSTYNEGTYHFKKKFKPTFYAINSKINYNKNAKLLLASKIWKRLPLSVANLISPKIRKYLP